MTRLKPETEMYGPRLFILCFFTFFFFAIFIVQFFELMSIFSPAAATLEEPDGIALLRSARLYNKERHERRVSLLHQHHKNCHDKATIRMLNVIKSDEGKQARMENLIKKLQSNLTALSLLFLKIVEVRLIFSLLFDFTTHSNFCGGLLTNKNRFFCRRNRAWVQSGCSTRQSWSVSKCTT